MSILSPKWPRNLLKFQLIPIYKRHPKGPEHNINSRHAETHFFNQSRQRYDKIMKKNHTIYSEFKIYKKNYGNASIHMDQF